MVVFLLLGPFGLFCFSSYIVDVPQSLSRVWLFVTPWTAARQASLSFTISWSLLKLIESMMPSNPLILLLCPSPHTQCSHKHLCVNFLTFPLLSSFEYVPQSKISRAESIFSLIPLIISFQKDLAKLTELSALYLFLNIPAIIILLLFIFLLFLSFLFQFHLLKLWYVKEVKVLVSQSCPTLQSHGL